MHDKYGQRLMPTILRDEARQNPQRTFAIAAISNTVEDGFRQITFEEIARAVNYVSMWLQSLFEDDNPPPQHATIAYIGVPDLRYNIFFYGALQCRYKVFLPSPRNPTDVNVSLLQQTICSRLVYSAEVGPVANILQAALPGLQCGQIPSLDELLAAPATDYSYDLKYEDVFREPILILHSSGSTGQPKPVVNTHGTFATYDVRDWPTVPGCVNHDGLATLRFSQPNSRIYDVFPPFHIAGFMTKVMVPLYNLTAPIFGPPLRPPSGALAAEMIRLHKPRGAVLPPSISEQLYHEQGGAELLKQLDVLLFAGGPLPQVVGDELSKYTTLCQFYGSTEMGQIRQLVPLPEDWSYIQFHPNERFELQPAGECMFELVVFADKDLERTSSLYHNYPDVHEWRTKDLFKPHPNKPVLWKFHARKDDILVFSSGEKLNPIPMESSITAFSGVNGALVVGQGQSQASLLVELSQNGQFSSDPRQDLWPAIETANALLPGHGRIGRSMILIADSTKPFVRAGKGTVVRRLTEDLYTTEIQKLYEIAPSQEQTVPIVLKPSVFHINDIKELIRAILDQVSINSQLDDEDNFYIHGMDSVRTTEAVGILKTTLLPYKPMTDLRWISGDILYRNPTLKRLSLILLEFLNHSIIPVKRDRIGEMQAKIKEYTCDLPRNLASPNKAIGAKFSIAVTGTTGYLGRRLLTNFTKDSCISRIYCLNRSRRAQQIFERHNPQNTADIVFLHVNLASRYLGLSNKDYTRLLQECNIIVHNAWRVDFNLTLDSFEDNLQSVKHLINLSVTSPLRPRIAFISSISTTGVWAPKGSPQQIIREHVTEDLSATMDIGYAESKQVAEQVLHAASQAGIPATVIRMGQISPSSLPEEKGTWPSNDVVPVFLQTCKTSGMLASDFVDTINWIPVDQAAEVVNDIVQYEVKYNEVANARFYNLVNLNPQPWSTVLDLVQRWCGEATETVAMQQWVQRLRASDTSDLKMLDKLPALRLLKIYDLMANHGPENQYVKENLMAASKRIVKLPRVEAKMLDMWLQQL
ncbi:putative NRPS-like enzyme [Tricladium varicosporioides]|nr:putative NRPS-like enzyme [Hymenoscyphus varicosporioides]